MKRIAAILALLVPACGSDNPYDTSSEQEAFDKKDEEMAGLKLSKEGRRPRQGEVAFRDPALEGWRDTILDSADSASLVRMHRECAQRIALLEARQKDLAALNPFVTRVERDELRYQLTFERTRLKMIEDRQAAGRGD